MVGRKKNEDAPALPAEAQPSGSGAVPGSTAPPFGEQLKTSAAGTQVQPGVNDGTVPEPDAPELQDDPNTDPELAEAAEEPMVVYQGGYGRREITREQWAEAGVPNMPTIVWERRTGFKVPASVFTEQAMQVLRQDQGFRVP